MAYEYGSTDRFTGGTPSAQGTTGATTADKAVDGDTGTGWQWQNGDGYAGSAWWKYDFGAAVDWAIGKLRYYPNATEGWDDGCIVAGSNDDSDWTTIGTIVTIGKTSAWHEYEFTPGFKTEWRYIKISGSGDNATRITVQELEVFEITKFPSGFMLFLSEAYDKGKKYFKKRNLWLPDDRLYQPGPVM